ncbi:hypothetical protein BpHYR1_032107 [Brachionus plicatilis]|uniref:Uncharacterized protein n=1 Tax=Brachionus plicatilis TaxID=10195 RepID=A0A3M7RCC9_BRAPC|nr:hypothetical protein BpHYR1_032107 [Brachionus plicatilis]
MSQYRKIYPRVHLYKDKKVIVKKVDWCNSISLKLGTNILKGRHSCIVTNFLKNKVNSLGICPSLGCDQYSLNTKTFEYQ